MLAFLLGAAAKGQVVFSEDFEGGTLPPEITGAGDIEGVQSYAGLGPAGGTFSGSFQS